MPLCTVCGWGFRGEQAQRSALLQAAVSWYGVDIRQTTAQAPVLYKL